MIQDESATGFLLNFKKVYKMENQHRLIKGYRDLSKEEIDAMNAIKQEGERLGFLIEELESNKQLDQRWVSIAKNNLQQGIMAAVRAIAKPESF